MSDDTQLETLVMPERLLDAINSINISVNSSMTKEELLSWVPIREFLWKNIMREESLGHIRPGQKVLELGSGSGDSILTWSYQGYPVTGIELNSELFSRSKEFLKRYSSMQNAPVQLFSGSYYSKEYLKDRKNDDNIVRIEKECVSHLRANGTSNVDHLRARFRPVCDVDVYKANGIDMKDFDIWYAYLWTYQAPSVLDMFKKYARDDAKMLLISKWGDDVALELGLEVHKSSNIVTKKQHPYSFYR